MTQQNDRAVLEAVVAALQPDDIARFDANRYRKRGSGAPSRTVLKRLAEAGHIEVESHNVSHWSYGPPAPMYYWAWQRDPALPTLDRRFRADEIAACEAYDAFMGEIGDPWWEDRTEVWIRVTPRGREYLEMLQALS